MGVTVITTIKNEEKSIREFLDSLLNQSHQPDSIIITDGGSTDQTCEIILKEYIPINSKIKLIQENCNIARGRNLAIKESNQPIIAVTDAGCKLKTDWLEKLIQPLEYNASMDVTAGVTEPDADSPLEKIIGGYLTVSPHQMKENSILLSSRNLAFRKSIWEKIGGYPEWLYLSGEDTLFDKELQKINTNIQIVPDAIVYWKPPANFKKLFTQTYSYSRGNGQGGLYFSQFLKLLFFYPILMVLFTTGFFIPYYWTFFGVLLLSYFSYSGFKLCRKLHHSDFFLLAIAVKFVLDMANLTGYINGILLRFNKYQ